MQPAEEEPCICMYETVTCKSGHDRVMGPLCRHKDIRREVIPKKSKEEGVEYKTNIKEITVDSSRHKRVVSMDVDIMLYS